MSVQEVQDSSSVTNPNKGKGLNKGSETLSKHLKTEEAEFYM